ncbi:hypothetical protein M407DRAFT_31046 [Tulasnella calospora MUT 4182]|uniref:Uncharacterized protein n=1 Tax=Tulasnella calospora MUT 4182 TaxID=1051891 RepID=A0A0C3PWC2_9AGAM|nr:hypothetical protein M407DRAFT_31046 [Tulasnella calospora MUT 4182]
MVTGVTIARTRANGNQKWAAKKKYQTELLRCIRAFKRPDGLVQEGELAAVDAAVNAWSLAHAQAFHGSYGSCAETYPILSMVRKPQPGQTVLRLRGLALQPEEFQTGSAEAILASSLATEAKVSMLFPLLFVEACQGCQTMFEYLELPYDQLGPGEP